MTTHAITMVTPDSLRLRASSDKATLTFFTVETVLIIFLQKLALPIGGGVELALPLMFAGLIILGAFRGFCLSPIRVALFTAFMLFAVISQALSAAPFSGASLLFMLVLFTTFLFQYDVSQETYRRCLGVYQNVMLIGCGILFAQDIWQIIWGADSVPNMDRLVPARFLLQGYVYLQPIYWGSPFMKPNGFFFLEVSAISQLTAVALVIELVFFHRLWRLSIYAAALFASFAGTGLLLLVLVAPVLALRMNRKVVAISVIVMGGAVACAIAFGWYDQVHQRFNEIDTPGSSSYARFVQPLLSLQMIAEAADPIWTGIGAGNILKGPDIAWWALAKLLVEYGLATTMAFAVFFTYCLFAGAPSRRLSVALFILFNLLGGNLHTPVIIELCALLGTMLRVEPPTMLISSPVERP